MFAEPILTLFLAAGWAQNNIRIKQHGDYIRKRIEAKIVGGGWENCRLNNLSSSTNNVSRHSLSVVFGRGIFLSVQVVMIAFAISKVYLTKVTVLLTISAILATIFTIYLTRRTIIK